ncbi:MAG: hypothetical protein ACRC0Y_04020 [Fusobacteriaceae bacterium]
MNLLELLRKRNNKEELTEEEKAFLVDYDSSIAIYASEIEKLKVEKESAEARFGNANSELQGKLKSLSAVEESLKRELEEKENMKKIIDNAKSAEEAKIEIEKARAEKVRLEEVSRVERESAEKLKKESEDKKAFEIKQKELEETIATMVFERKVLAEKAKRPYLEIQLNKVVAELPSKGLIKSETYFDMLIDMFNHEEEMAKWEAKKKVGSDIFGKADTKIVEDKKETKVVDKDSDVLAIAKKLGFKVRKK